MQAFARTDTGRVRKMNQDYVYCNTSPVGPLPNLFIVADGMGGHQAGDFASRYATEVFVKFISESSESNLIKLVDRGIALANTEVYEKSCEDPGLAGMGTTLVVAYVEDGQLYVANIGDSRLYLISSEINQVTEDHSFVEAMVKAGEITREEARCHPDKNVITRALGVAPTVKADFFEVDLAPGDKILICSDGLSNMIEDERIYSIISEYDAAKAAELLIEEANENGGNDNITDIIIVPEIKEVSEC